MDNNLIIHNNLLFVSDNLFIDNNDNDQTVKIKLFLTFQQIIIFT